MARSVSARSFRFAMNRFLSATALTAVGIVGLSTGADANDNPWSQFDDVAGSISIDTSNAGHTLIDQHTQTYIGNSNNLDILQGQSVTIGQNNTGALFVGRATSKGSDPTRILGTLNTRLKDGNGNFTDATGGSVMVLDRNGVVFGKDSRVDAGGIIASTGDIGNDDLLNNDGQYEFSNFGGGKIDLQGSISVSDAGLAAFVSPNISNSGVINAKVGKVVMAAGEKVTLDLYGDNLVEVAVSDELSDALIENTGDINAQGGTVIVRAEAAKEIVNNVINMGGTVNASSAEVKGGKIVLGGGQSGKVNVTGTLDASGATGGGAIDVTGQSVEIAQGASIKADAINSGKGGDVDLIGQHTAILAGDVSAKGGAENGDGGFVELSAGEEFLITGSVDTTAANGKTGTFLIDPRDIDFRVGVRGLDLSLNRVYESDIEVLSYLTNIDLLARRNFTVNANTFGPSDGVITVNGGNDLRIRTTNAVGWQPGDLFPVNENNPGVINLTGNATYGANLEWKTSGNGSITIQGATSNQATSDITLSKLTTQNGNIFVETKNGSITWAGDVTTQGGSITGVATKQNNVSANLATQTGDINLTGGGTNFWDTGILLANNGTLNTASGDINLLAKNTKLVINGAARAGTGDLSVIADNQGRIEYWGAGLLQGNNVDLQSGLGITQGATGTLIANVLTGVSKESTSLLGANNQIGTIASFATGTAGGNAGGFALHDVDGFDVTGTVTTQGGNIAVTTNSNSFDKAIDIKSTGSFVSNGGAINLDNNGASGGFITVAGKIDAKGTAANAGNVTLNARQLRLNGASTIDANVLTTNGALVNQQATSAVTANKLEGTLTAQADFRGLNKVKEIGNFTTGTGSGVGGFLFNSVSGQRLDVAGALKTDGGDVAITHNNRLDVRAAGSILTKGGDVNLTVNTNSFIYADGTIDTRDAGGNGAVTLDGKSNIEMRSGGKIYGGLVTLKSGNIVNQAAGAQITADKLEGDVHKTVSLLGNNAIASIGNFATGTHPIASEKGGFKLVNGVNTAIVGTLLGGNGNVDLNVTGNISVAPTGSINAEGGNIDLKQSGAFASGANTLKTSGTGTINVEQRAGGKINDAVQAFDNSGTGINTALVHNGTYNENVLISDSNVHLVSANGRANTTIIGDESYGGQGTVEIANGANNVKLGDYNKGFKIVGFDGSIPAQEKAAVYIQGAHEGLRVIHNEIVANGEGGLLTEYGFALNNVIIDSNIFSGQTFIGANPSVGTQDAVHNVPRALLFIGGANGGQNKTNIAVTNNQFTGTVGGVTTGGGESSNTAVTVDAHTARITGNTFNATVKGTATALRARGTNTLISGNTFNNANLGTTAGHLLVSQNVYNGALVVGVQDDINDIWANNTFIGNVTTTDNTGTSGTSDYIGYKIQGAVNAASNGARIRVSDGTFNEAVNVNKSVSITGTGTTNTTIVDGTGLGANADGFTINANDISLNGMIVRNFGRAGINVQSGNRTNISLDDIDASGNKFGLRTSTSAGIDGFTVTNSHFDNNEQGWVIQKGNDSSVFNNVTVTNTTFNNNSDKGIYAEKLSNAQFTDVTVNNSGTRANYNANAGIDINLKYGNYSNIAFNNVTVTGSGANGTGSGVALTVKARDDGSYASNPASLTNLSINGGTVSGAGDTAIALGNNITGAVVDGVTVSGNNGIVVYGGVDQVTLSDNIMTLTGTSIGVSDSDDVSIVRNNITGGTTGIALNNVTNGTVGGSLADANTIRDIVDGWNNAGISIRNGGDLVVSYNDLRNVGGQSIRVDGSWGMPETALSIANNKIKDAQFNAITLAHWNGATISGNEIDGVEVSHGIHLDLARNTKVLGNTISNVTGDAINLRRGNIATTIQSNTISNAANGIVLARIGSEINQQTLIGDTFGGPLGNTISNVGTGIQTDGAENTWIDSNKINKASVAGIDVKDGTGYSIVNFNKIDGSGHGIRMVNSTSGVIASNKIGLNANMTGHGITVQDSKDTDVLSNELKNVAQRGINIVRGENIDVNDNILEKIGQNGIRTDQVKGINLNRNKLENIGWSGIELQGGSNATVNRNVVKKAGGNGIQISGTNGVNITTNTVNDVRENGIIATGAAKAVISGNTVDLTGKDGVAVVNSANAQILNNKIGLNGGANNIGTGAVGGDGIYVTGGNGAVIKGNDIANTKYNASPAKGSGILVVKSSNVTIGGTASGEANKVNNAGSDGIVIRADGGVADNNSIIGNLIENVQRTGVYLSNATNTTVHRNVINNAGITLPDNGVITAFGGSNVTITRNDINGGAGHGIQLNGIGGTNIVRNNDVDGVVKDGISAQGVSDLRIVNNDIGQAGTIGGNGVSVAGSNGARINGNTINRTGNNGILLTGGTDLNVRENVIGLNAPVGNIGGNGIETNGVGDVRIVGNEIRRTVRDAILANGTGTARINRNIIRNVGGDGIDASGFADARINRNRIVNAGEDGIEVHGSAKATLNANRVTNSAEKGIYVSGQENGTVILTANRLVDNTVGAEFETGTIDLTGATNTISGGDIGLRFDPKSAANASKLTLVNDITKPDAALYGGTIGSTVFEGLTDPTDQFIVLANGAFFAPGNPTLIDARFARFNGKSAADDATGRFRLYQTELDAIEAQVHHFVDENTLGRIFYGNLNSIPVIIGVTSIDQEDLMQYFSPVNLQLSNLNITVNGLPSIPGSLNTAQSFNAITPFAGGFDPASLNNITPAAGGDDQGQGATTAAALNNLTPASGGEQASCWGDASGKAQGGQVVSINYGSSAEDMLNSAASCSVGL